MRTRIQKAENGDGIIELPDELLKQMGLGIGETLYLAEEFVGNIKCLVLSKTPRFTDRIDELAKHWDQESQTEQLKQRAIQFLGSPDKAERWLNQPMSFLNGLTPRQAVAEGRLEDIMQRLDQGESGFVF